MQLQAAKTAQLSQISLQSAKPLVSRCECVPCLKAAAVQVAGQDLLIPEGNTFKYLDRNTRQSSECEGYNYEFEFDVQYCWVLGEYDGYVGWVAVQSVVPS